jgi:hypothetical protein
VFARRLNPRLAKGWTIVFTRESKANVTICYDLKELDKLKKRNHLVDFISFEDEGHSIVKQKNKMTAYKEMVKFLDRYIGNGS